MNRLLLQARIDAENDSAPASYGLAQQLNCRLDHSLALG